MELCYLVIWQLGLNEQSHTETPINIKINSFINATEKYRLIREALREQTGEFEDVRIKSICKL
jgi:hypothetical protein